MNQLEAHVTIITFVREQAPEDLRVVRALKIFEKRHAKLLAKHERRHAVPPADLGDEPLLVTFRQFRSAFDGDICLLCMREKSPHNAFCVDCFSGLPASLAVAFRTAGAIHQAFCRALRLAGCKPVQMPSGMLAWPDGSHPLDSRKLTGPRATARQTLKG